MIERLMEAERKAAELERRLEQLVRQAERTGQDLRLLLAAGVHLSAFNTITGKPRESIGVRIRARYNGEVIVKHSNGSTWVAGFPLRLRNLDLSTTTHTGTTDASTGIWTTSPILVDGEYAVQADGSVKSGLTVVLGDVNSRWIYPTDTDTDLTALIDVKLTIGGSLKYGEWYNGRYFTTDLHVYQISINGGSWVTMAGASDLFATTGGRTWTLTRFTGTLGTGTAPRWGHLSWTGDVFPPNYVPDAVDYANDILEWSGSTPLLETVQIRVLP